MFSELLGEGNRLYSYHLSRVQSHPPNYTTYYLTLTEPKSNTFTSCWHLKPDLAALAKKKTTMLVTVHYVDCCKRIFWWTAWLPIPRWQSASSWLCCLLGKDSRLYSYLKKRLHNPTTIQSTTSAPRTASTLLQHQRSTKVTALQWYKEKETERVILIIYSSQKNTCKIKLGRIINFWSVYLRDILDWCVQIQRVVFSVLSLCLCFCAWKWFKITTYGWTWECFVTTRL